MPETEHPNFPLFATRLYSLANLIGFMCFNAQLPEIETFGNLQTPSVETEEAVITQVRGILSKIYSEYALNINLSTVTTAMESALEIMQRSERVVATEQSAVDTTLQLSWELVRRTIRS